MSVETLSQVTAIILSLGMAYIPGLAGWYDALSKQSKAGVMAVLLLVVAGGSFALACTGLAADFGISLVCDQVSAIGLVKVLVNALIANQAAFLLAVRPFRK